MLQIGARTTIRSLQLTRNLLLIVFSVLSELLSDVFLLLQVEDRTSLVIPFVFRTFSYDTRYL